MYLRLRKGDIAIGSVSDEYYDEISDLCFVRSINIINISVKDGNDYLDFVNQGVVYGDLTFGPENILKGKGPTINYNCCNKKVIDNKKVLFQNNGFVGGNVKHKEISFVNNGIVHGKFGNRKKGHRDVSFINNGKVHGQFGNRNKRLQNISFKNYGTVHGKFGIKKRGHKGISFENNGIVHGKNIYRPENIFIGVC